MGIGMRMVWSVECGVCNAKRSMVKDSSRGKKMGKGFCRAGLRG